MLLVEKNANFQKDEPCASAQVKLWWVGAHKRKKGSNFLTFVFYHNV